MSPRLELSHYGSFVHKSFLIIFFFCFPNLWTTLFLFDQVASVLNILDNELVQNVGDYIVRLVSSIH
jgi:hypothetical protein